MVISEFGRQILRNVFSQLGAREGIFRVARIELSVCVVLQFCHG